MSYCDASDEPLDEYCENCGCHTLERWISPFSGLCSACSADKDEGFSEEEG